ncbi:unnamed protein product [Clonostachys rosea]|uniref:Transcription factor domain-containing protein n=1 Tax=Bionectria ochroleuca TaxID=29856 RepID=A0ABY6UQ80_BIOOC|nr:unnamed protein product [Clonostachys rosea]
MRPLTLKVTKPLWIVSTSLDQPDEATRKVMRSHVMRDKNTRDAKRQRKVARLMADDNSRWVARKLSRAALEAQGDVAEWVPKSSGKLAAELALAGFDMELTPHMLDLIYRAFTLIKPATFSLENALVASPQQTMYCFDNIAHNPGLVHSMLFTAQCLYDTTLGVAYSNAARWHLAKALFYLQQYLQSNNSSTSNATMAVIVSLATSAIMLQDFGMVKAHMDGLYRLIQLRGGLSALGEGSMVEHKAQRIDFAVCLATGEQSRFFREVLWVPHIATDGATRCPELRHVCPDLDPRIQTIWADLREFSKAANEATRTNVKMTPGFFSRLSQSVPYRLLAIEFDVASNSELLRLCMLAYVKYLLNPIKGFGKHLVYLARRIKASLLAHQLVPGKQADGLIVWALFVVASSVYEDFDREWIQDMMSQAISNLALHRWEEISIVLERYLWIRVTFEGPAKALYRQWWPQGNLNLGKYPTVSAK